MFYLKKQLYSWNSYLKERQTNYKRTLKKTKIKIQFNLVLFKDNI